MKKSLILSAVAVTLALSSGLLMAENNEMAGDRLETQQQVYGRQLMTQQERVEFRDKMRSASSAEERQQIQQEHHEQMKLRAKERGLSMPENPPADGMGMGKGMGGAVRVIDASAVEPNCTSAVCASYSWRVSRFTWL